MNLRVAKLLTPLALLVAGPALGAEYVNDPLTSESHPGRGSKGGSFSPSGWTTTNAPTDGSQDAVWYEIPDALPTGSVEVTITGLSLGTTLGGSDHDLLVMYQAPTGHPEPVQYSPYFRNNDFKAFLRIFGTQEVERPGAMKLELAFCPRGDPWWHDDPCTPECDQGAIAYANGQQTDVGWDAATPYTLRMEWAPGVMRFLRNGQNLGEVNFTGVYAPKPLRVRIGTPRNDGIYPGEVYMPQGLTFKDVRIEGTPGEMTQVCGAVVTPDGGSGGATSDAGSGSSMLGVLQDVSAASWMPGVFEDVTDLNVEANPDGTPASVVYLRFPPIGGVVQKALLRLRAHGYSEAAGGSGVVCRVNDDTWQETTVTWQNRPPIETTCAGSSMDVEPDNDVEWDVTSLVASSAPGQNINLAIVSSDPNGAHLMSKEASAALGPRLYLTTSGAGAGGSAAGGSSGWSDAGIAAAGGASAASGTDRGGAENDSGCGCRVGSSGTPSLGVLLALALLLRRKRQ